MGYKNILLTLDGSPLAEQALQAVSAVAEPGAFIHVISIVVPEKTGYLMAVARSGALVGPIIDSEVLHSFDVQDSLQIAQLKGERRTYLEKVTAPLIAAGYNVFLDVREGSVVSQILKVASGGCDVIVMATHGRSGITKVLMGSVAEAVLHEAHQPVLLIPAHAA